MASGRLKCASSSAGQITKMTCTPIVPNYEALDALDLFSSPDSQIDGGDWCQSYSLSSLCLTLEDIVEACKVPNKHVLEEFPFPCYLSVLGSAGAVPPSPSRPQAHLDSGKLQLKCSQLKSLVKFHENRIHWLSTGSRMYFGHLSGSNVALLVEASDHLFQECEEYKDGLKLLIDEQLVQKEAVHLIQFGSEVKPTKPECLHFSTKKNRCSELASHWLSSLEGSGGCDVLGALRVALRLKQVDTVCVVVSSRPNQPFEVLLDHLVERLSGCDAPQLHVVSFNGTEETAAFLSRLAMETGGHYHRFASTFHEDQKGYEVEDTDISRIEEEMKRIKEVLDELKALESGIVGGSLLGVLRELSLTAEWPDDDFPPFAPLSGKHSTPCSTQQWLEQHGLTRHRLGLYQFLAPNAYSQLETFVDTIERKVASQVYEVMPLFEWSDGSHKYLHVDVPQMEKYQGQLEGFIADTLQVRLNWLLSGSRVPFGVITEQRVLVALDCSYLVLAQILVLQQHLRTLLEEQLSHITAFNLLRFGKECCTWRSDFAEPSHLNLLDAWEWVLGMSPAGSCNLLSALRLVFESNMVFETNDSEDVGLYLIVSAMPDQDTDTLCSYVEQQAAGRGVTLHVVFYDTEPLATELVIPGREGGRWGDEGETEECLRQVAKAGGGRFHHFKLSGSVEGDDITAMMDEVSEAHFYLKTARNVVANYREFCKRNVPPATPPLSGSTTSTDHRARQAPPLYPRQTNTSLSRMNTCLHHRGGEEAVKRDTPNSKKYIKIHPFYLDQGLRKGVARELLDHTPPSKLKNKPIIPNKEEHISSKEWVTRYELKKLGLGIETVFPASAGCHGDQGKKRTMYKHINHHGEVVELYVSHRSLRGYAKKLRAAVNRYQSRLEWLLEDDRKFFGAIVERKVLFLLDVSSSMAASLQEVVEALAQLLLQWGTCPVHKVKSFNIVTYASTVSKWQEELVPVSGDCCAQAVQWLHEVRAGGASCLLEALKVSFQSGAAGIYLVTDGIPDHTHEFLLNQLPLLRKSYGSGWMLNTVAFRCSDQDSQDFLKSLASRSGGRYHSHPLPSGLVAKQQDIVSLAREPTLGDDVRLLVEQVLLAQNHLADVQTLL